MDITLDRLFGAARTQQGWLDTPLPDDTLRRLYDALKWGPTSANCTPARFVFVRTPPAKATLAACCSRNNAPKVLAAPVTVIVGMDLRFPDLLPRLFPHTDAKSWFDGDEQLIEQTALRNSSLQGAYLIIAARALGLDAGPMSGFDAPQVDAAFWAGTPVRTNFICSLGHGDPAKLRPRGPRLAFDEACRLA
jgi:3-hydroxypropanoate dehydrogenase